MMNDIIQYNLGDRVEEEITVYGTETLRHRAIPSLVDGLKPVQRKILWSMYGLHLHSKAKRMKAMRTIGEVLGKYHPHGDESVNKAMDTMANSPESYIDGEGNWGTIKNESAAPRYKEARLSAYTDENFFNPDYLTSIDFILNYDDSQEEPLQLPSNTLNLLINGSEGIAVGATSTIPAFTKKSVNKVLSRFLSDKSPSVGWIAKTLEHHSRFGGHVADIRANKEQMQRLVDTGTASIVYHPDYAVKGSKIIITGFPKNLRRGTELIKLANDTRVASIVDETSIESGVRFVINCKRGTSMTDKVILSILRPVIIRRAYKLAYLTEKPGSDGKADVEFHATSMLVMIEKWIEWRKKLEEKSIDYRVRVQDEKIEKIDLFLLAHENRDVLDACRDKKNPSGYLQKNLEINAREADVLLGLTVRQLTRISKRELLANRKECLEIIDGLNECKENIEQTIINALEG